MGSRLTIVGHSDLMATAAAIVAAVSLLTDAADPTSECGFPAQFFIMIRRVDQGGDAR